MNTEKQKKVNRVKLWLQKFGDRDNETFYKEIEVGDINWRISMQYTYDDDGDEIISSNWCCRNFKHVFNNAIEDRTEEELEAILFELQKIKNVW